LQTPSPSSTTRGGLRESKFLFSTIAVRPFPLSRRAGSLQQDATLPGAVGSAKRRADGSSTAASPPLPFSAIAPSRLNRLHSISRRGLGARSGASDLRFDMLSRPQAPRGDAGSAPSLTASTSTARSSVPHITGSRAYFYSDNNREEVSSSVASVVTSALGIASRTETSKMDNLTSSVGEDSRGASGNSSGANTTQSGPAAIHARFLKKQMLQLQGLQTDAADRVSNGRESSPMRSEELMLQQLRIRNGRSLSAVNASDISAAARAIALAATTSPGDAQRFTSRMPRSGRLHRRIGSQHTSATMSRARMRTQQYALHRTTLQVCAMRFSPSSVHGMATTTLHTQSHTHTHTLHYHATHAGSE
jgi:hypothetical protein